MNEDLREQQRLRRHPNDLHWQDADGTRLWDDVNPVTERYRRGPRRYSIPSWLGHHSPDGAVRDGDRFSGECVCGFDLEGSWIEVTQRLTRHVLDARVPVGQEDAA